jgi:peptidoglycan-associated lipoprotein
MKVAKLLFAINLLMACLFTTSCQRSSGEVWEDTKSAGRYTSRAVGSLGGKHGDSRQVKDRQQFGTASNDQEYTPLKDEDLYRQISNGDINSDSAIPQSKENPGELGSGIPGIDGFKEPTSGELSYLPLPTT